MKFIIGATHLARDLTSMDFGTQGWPAYVHLRECVCGGVGGCCLVDLRVHVCVCVCACVCVCMCVHVCVCA